MTVTAPDLPTVIEAVRAHGDRLCEDVREGRLDRVEEALSAREEALQALAALVAERGDALDPAEREALEALRDDDRRLVEWMREEKKAVGRALGSLQGRVDDPYRESLDGHAVLDQRR